MNEVLSAGICLLSLSLISPVFADDDDDDRKMRIRKVQIDEQPKTVTMVGTRAKNVGFVTFEEGVNANCVNQTLYFDISKSMGKTFLSTLSLVKISDTKIRIGYSAPLSREGMCKLQLAALIN